MENIVYKNNEKNAKNLSFFVNIFRPKGIILFSSKCNDAGADALIMVKR